MSVTLVETVAVILWLGVTMYAVLAGADFGTGFWDLLAGGDKRGAKPRALIDVSIGPVWEANHVWLIFVLVVLWTAFPTTFASIMLTLYIPLGLAALGIVFRGTGFAYRHVTADLRARRAFGAVFAISSILTPFFFGTVAGAIASGRVPDGGEAGDPMGAWWNPTSLFCGVLAVTVCAYMAAVFLVSDARRQQSPDLERYFLNRAFAAGCVAGAVALIGLFVLREEARSLYDGLTGQALPLVALSAVCGIAALVLLWKQRPRFTRILAAGAVAAIVWGWGVAQEPWMLPETLRLDDAAAASSTLWAVVVVFGLAIALIGPSMALLFHLDQRSELDPEDLEAETAANRGDTS